MLRNFDESEEEINLDLPMVMGKKNISNIICESSEAESFEENSIGNDNENDNIVDSDLENSGTRRKKSKKNQFLSRDYIDNSDFDDNPLTLEEISRMTKRSDSENESDSFEVDEDGKRIKKSKSHKSKNAEEFVKASEDFKSRLKFMSYDDSDSENSSNINVNDNEFDDDADADNEVEDNNGKDRKKQLKVKKPKETLKNVLKESEALLRREISVDLEIEVPKPKTIDFILNEALAVNSRSPAEAKKRVIDEKRKIQRMKLEKILGPERMATLIKDEPKIGHLKLDESFEILIEAVDEKAPEGEEISKEIFKVKLTDLPDKRFDCKKSKSTDNSSNAGYKNYIQSQKKASIELLNIQLQEKIRAQSNVALLHHQRAHSAHLAAKRAKAEERERKRKEAEVKKERELKEKREKMAGGGELFKKEKYEGVERRPINADDDEILGHEIKKPATRIILSDDDEEVDGDIEDLLNLGDSEGESLSNTESESLPDISEAMDDDRMDVLLSGKFADEHSETDLDKSVLATATVHKKTEIPRIKSMFIDDEASDEDEEKENDEIDEEELLEEMQKSNFIVESDESDFDPAELRAFVNEKAKKEDSEIEKKLLAKLGNHLDDEGEEDEFLNSLGNKYGLNDNVQYSKKKKRSLVSQSTLDEDIKKLLDPIEQKKRKLAALGSLNILNRQRQVEAASEEFQFVKKTSTAIISDCSSDYYATDDSSDDSDTSDHGYYEEVESGLQSRVEEMLEEEMLDGEEVQVQATESLSAHLQTFNTKEDSENADEIKYHNDQSNQNDNSISSKISIPSFNMKTRGVAVPIVDAKLKSRLLALQQENDETSNIGGNNNEKFKGFSINKK